MKNLFIVALLLCTALCTAIFVTLHRSPIEDVIVCASSEESHYIPMDLCRYYLYEIRDTREDLHALQERAGLAYVFGIENNLLRYEMTQFLINKGISVNTTSAVDGLTPLHAAVLMNDAELVGLLIQSGADVRRRNRNGLDVWQFLNQLKATSPEINRVAVERRLYR